MTDHDTALPLQDLLCKAITEWFDTGKVQLGNYPATFHSVLISQQQIGRQHLFMGHWSTKWEDVICLIYVDNALLFYKDEEVVICLTETRGNPSQEGRRCGWFLQCPHRQSRWWIHSLNTERSYQERSSSSSTAPWWTQHQTCSNSCKTNQKFDQNKSYFLVAKMWPSRQLFSLKNDLLLVFFHISDCFFGKKNYLLFIFFDLSQVVFSPHPMESCDQPRKIFDMGSSQNQTIIPVFSEIWQKIRPSFIRKRANNGKWWNYTTVKKNWPA